MLFEAGIKLMTLHVYCDNATAFVNSAKYHDLHRDPAENKF